MRVWTLGLMLMACGGGGAPTDDAGTADVGMMDAGLMDGGDMRDAGPDGETPDAGGDASVCVCDSPPADECADATTLREYARTGECVGGECEYATRETECEVPAPTCVDDVATTWSDAGCMDGACVATPTELSCSNGCCDDGCCEMTPSNSDELGGLGSSVLTLEPPDGFTFNTDTDCEGTTAIGECTAVDVFDSPDVCVCRSERLRIGGTLNVAGSRALALFARETILVRGVLDASGTGTISGPGTAFEYSTVATGSNGGAGGSYGSEGAGAAASVYGNSEIVPLQGGMDGQDACGSRRGGGGGGALQLSAGIDIEVTGIIDVSGGGGAGGNSSSSCNGGAGGGSGGAVLIEAPAVEITGTVVANGGGGGSAATNSSSGRSGFNGSTTGGGGGGSAPECGCPLFGYTNGGDGGRGASGTFGPSFGESSDSVGGCIGTCVVGGGGDGGGLGRIRVNTTSGCLCGGTFSPNASFGSVTVD